jgi:hypothetical protein
MARRMAVDLLNSAADFRQMQTNNKLGRSLKDAISMMHEIVPSNRHIESIRGEFANGAAAVPQLSTAIAIDRIVESGGWRLR